MPQVAMAHPGSCASTSRKALSPSANENECNSATARVNFACTAGWHDVGNDTSPSCSGGLPGESPQAAVAAANEKQTIAAVRMVGCIMAFSLLFISAP